MAGRGYGGYAGLFGGGNQILFFLIVLLLICGCGGIFDGGGEGVLGGLFANNGLLIILVFLFFFGCGGCGGFGGFGY